MNCKNCQAELAEGVTLCPQCGTENAVPAEETPVMEAPAIETPVAETDVEETPAKTGLSAGRITLLVALAIAAVAIVVALIVGGRGSGEPAETTAPAGTETVETTPPATIPPDGNPDDVTCKGSYTVSDDEMTAQANTVVATMGGVELTNADLQVYYWMQVYDFLNSYGSYAAAMGLDYTNPIDTQLSIDGTLTWQQYFLDSAIATWQNYTSMCLSANEAGFVLDQEYVDYLDALPTELETNAQTLGYENALDMIQADMGVGGTLEAYMNYLNSYYLSYMYYGTTLEGMELTAEDVEAYFDEHAADYEANGLTKGDDKYVDVRHILLSPEGGTTDESGVTTYSEEEWQACRLAAQDVLNEWLSGEKTEDSFAALANTHSTDPGSNTNGGLYEDVYVGQMVEPFEQWCFDETRKAGDYGIVQTDYGYHIMYYVNSDLIWYLTAENDLLTERGNAMLTEAVESYPMEIDYSAIALGFVDLAATE